MTASPEKSHMSAAHSIQKHSMPFYISTSLFHNKRLKRKRIKWAASTAASASASTSSAAATRSRRGATNNNNSYHHQRTKTDERRKQNLSQLQAEVTIDLLSDEDDTDSNAVISVNKCVRKMNSGTFIAMEEQLQQLQHNNHHQQQHFLVYPGHLQLSQVPNITLVPVVPSINHANTNMQTSTQKQRVKRKRKAQPKRLPQPTIMNNESIVLSDDSDKEADSPPIATSAPNPFKAAPTTAVSPTSTTLAPLDTVTSKPLIPSPPFPTAISYTSNATYSAQVDEEVTVSIVPRSSAAGSCSSSSAKKQTSPDELFPMLPDETTVHTVIANRIYELSLTKLREGLASCGIPEFQTNGGTQVSPTRRKGAQVTTPPLAIPPPTPISLKLSSDLSISLISDDEDEEQLQHQLSAEKFLQQQPQLSVQQLQLPAVPISMDGQYVAPRRRKLR